MTRLTALVLATLFLAAHAVSGHAAGTIDPQYDAVLANPTDPYVNNAYALRAETRGEYRKALAAYERVLIDHPDNAEAIEGLMRVRRRLQPAFTQFFLELGGAYQSNPRQFPSPFESDDGDGFASLRVLDERLLGSQRWRSLFAARGELFGNTDVLNNFDIEASVGPLIDVTPTIVFRPALIGGYSWLDGGTFFGEGGVSLTLEGFLEGALQSVELRATYRDYDSRWVSDDGFVIDLLGHFAQNGVIGDGDAVILKPRLRWSGVESRPGVLLPAGFEPGRYFEVGAKAEYYYPFATWLLGGPNFALYQRWFSEPVVVGGSNRADTFYAPGAAIIIRDVVAQNVDIRFDYRFERQISNDPTRDFDNHYAGGRLLARF